MPITLRHATSLVSLAALFAAGGCAGQPVDAARPVAESLSPGTAAPVVSRATGALFADGDHFCSADVVHSPSGDLVLTAAHCVAEAGSGMSFAPGYQNGAAPLGMWTVTGVVVPDGWTTDADPDLDYAFLTVRQDGNPRSLESLTGADTLGTGRGFDNQITLTGYPDGVGSPVVCAAGTSRAGPYQQRIDCPGFPDGTSGGPWVTDVDATTGEGTVIGVIGGYEQGGYTPDVSYSAYFDDDMRALYASATR